MFEWIMAGCFIALICIGLYMVGSALDHRD